ncbi:MAG TPA: alpha/beta hydrolase, partial [Candidatus Eisenbacteria bacterium]
AVMSRRNKNRVWTGALLAAGGALGLSWVRYRREIRRQRLRVSTGSLIADTPGGPIEYAIAGAGSPVLVVHGAGGGYDQGLSIAGPLADRVFRLIAMSRFGYLRTPLPADASAEAQADAHARLLDALGVSRAAVVGASAGAPSAMQFALRHPDRASALVLLVPAAYTPRPGGAASVRTASERMPSGTGFLLQAFLGSDFAFWAAIRLALPLVTRGILGTPPEVLESADAAEKARVARILEEILPISARRAGLLNDAAVVSSLPRYELERIAVPTLAISAADCLYGTFDGARYTAENVPGARFIGYPTGGHMTVGRHEEILAEIADFLEHRALWGAGIVDPVAHAGSQEGSQLPA